jgi:hypothetical protein
MIVICAVGTAAVLALPPPDLVLDDEVARLVIGVVGVDLEPDVPGSRPPGFWKGLAEAESTAINKAADATKNPTL